MNTSEKHQQIGALLGVAYPVRNGERQGTLPEQIAALEDGVVRLGAEISKLRGENVALKTSEKTAEARAIEICAQHGVTDPVKADANKDAGKGGGNATNLTGLAAVEAMYRKKYGLNGEKARDS